MQPATASRSIRTNHDGILRGPLDVPQHRVDTMRSVVHDDDFAGLHADEVCELRADLGEHGLDGDAVEVVGVALDLAAEVEGELHDGGGARAVRSWRKCQSVFRRTL